MSVLINVATPSSDMKCCMFLCTLMTGIRKYEERCSGLRHQCVLSSTLCIDSSRKDLLPPSLYASHPKLSLARFYVCVCSNVNNPLLPHICVFIKIFMPTAE